MKEVVTKHIRKVSTTERCHACGIVIESQKCKLCPQCTYPICSDCGFCACDQEELD